MNIDIKQVDAFTRIPFGGNPAGVVTAAGNLADAQKLKIAREMNLSETAFVSASDKADFKVQFFTPRFEVDLCGHATIAAFSALGEEGKLSSEKTIFYQETKAGVLPVERIEINNQKAFMMTQAVPQYQEVPIVKAEAAQLLGLQEEDIMDAPIMRVSTGIWWLVLGVKKLEKLAGAKPDFKRIELISGEQGFVGITPFCLETYDKTCQYHMRAFAPFVGVNEDPVCGTGNGCVSSYLVHYGYIGGDEELTLMGEQGNEVERPGCVHIHIRQKSGTISEIKVGGSAVTVLEGKMRF